jgi:hypothetical protein
MEDFTFDIGSIMSPEEADKFFEEAEVEETTGAPAEDETENEPAEKEEPEEAATSEEVGEEENETEENAITQKGDGSSPNVYSSIASALKKDGIFPDFDDKELEAVATPEDFAELFDKAIQARMDERVRRIDAALGNGVEPDEIKKFEQTLQYLDGITEEAISAEGEEGDNLRRQLIYNDLINRGYSQEKARKELEKSFNAGSDVDDAKDALEALNKFYRDGYDKLQKNAKARADAVRENQKKQSEDFRKMILEDEVKLGESKLDKRTCQKVYDAVSKPVYKDPQSGRLLTAVQKFQQEQPLEFLKQLGMWYVLTDGGKNTDGFAKKQVRAEKNKGIRELERKINTTSLSSDGSLRYNSAGGGDVDPLLSDDWKIGW